MSDASSITPQARRKVYDLLRTKAHTLLGSKNFLLDPDHPIILPSPANFSANSTPSVMTGTTTHSTSP